MTRARRRVPVGFFIEIHCKCSPAECERRDPKGLYRKARAGDIRQFTGISAPYEEPESPEIVLETDRFGPEDCVQQVIAELGKRGVLSSSELV